MEIYRGFINSLYPKKKRCVICNTVNPQYLCKLCASSIEFINGRKCLKCGKGLWDNYSENICPDCKENDFTFHTAYSSFYYRGTGKEIIHKFKYEDKKEIGKVLARYLIEIIYNERLKVDIIVPVPIHENKLEVRGYNQAFVLGKQLSKIISIPIWDCLIRTKDTKAQYNLDKYWRKVNVHNAFSINMLYNVYSKRILLIDDVFTTGNTVEECSKVLKKSGASCIYVITAASGINT